MTAQGIAPGQPFLDQYGRIAQLHGIGILQVGDEFYAWGEDKSSGAHFVGVNCYSSRDLVRWELRGRSLAPIEGGDLGSDRIVERPKVLYDPVARRYVMFLHVDTADYAAARVGYAVSDTPVGPYTYVRSERPLGNASRDIGVFADDDDGAAYLLSEDREHGLHIYRLAPDLLSVVDIVSTTLTERGDHGYESPALVKHEGLYYLFGSDLTGWSTNDNKVATASSVAGPWSAWADIAPTGSATHDSQISAVLTVRGTRCVSHIFIGDRWRREDLYGSPPVWLPLTIGAGRAQLTWRDMWTVDPSTGSIG